MTKTAVLVSGGGANLQPILDLRQSLPEMELVGVISSSAEAYALERAKNAEVPTYLVERALFPNSGSFCSALKNKLLDLDAELVVCAGFTEKLSFSLLHTFRNRVVAVQPVLFPAWCAGTLDPVRAVRETLATGVRITGATAYFMTLEDNGYGPIILQKPVRVLQTDSVGELTERIMREGEQQVLPAAVKLYCTGRLRVAAEKVIITEEKQEN